MPLYALDGVAPTVPETAWVAPDAVLIGDVRLGARASVWFGAVIRADNTPILIGADSNVQDGAVLHSDPGSPLTIGDGVTVGHRAILHGCTVEDGVLVGMGSTLLNRAMIGEACLIGANALVTGGKTFDPRQLIVGAPAKAVRALDEAALAGLTLSAEIYVAKAGHYRAGLARIG